MGMVHIPNLNSRHSFSILLNVDVDGKVSIDVSHLVLVALGHASDQVIDDGLDGSESSDILSGAVVDFDSDGLETVLVLLLGKGEGHGDVGEVFCQFPCSDIVSVHISHIYVVVVAPSSLCAALVLCIVGFVPLGPSTVTILDRMWTLTSFGTTTDSSEKMYFILSSWTKSDG